MLPGPDLLGYAATVLSAVSFVPQVVKVLRTRETDDLSLATFVCTALALALWCVHGVWTGAMPVAIANGLTAALASIILFVKLRNDLAGRGGQRGRWSGRMSAAARARARRAPKRLRRPPDLRRGANDPRLAGFECLSMVVGNGDNDMNQDQAAGTWDVVKGKAKRIWGELTDDDFTKAEGSADKLYGIIQQRFGDAKEAIQRKLDQAHLP